MTKQPDVYDRGPAEIEFRTADEADSLMCVVSEAGGRYSARNSSHSS